MNKIKIFVTLALLATFGIAATAQRLTMNDGRAYRFAITTEQMAAVERGAAVDEAWLTRPVETVPLDSMESARRKTPYGCYVWVRQDGARLRTEPVNRVPAFIHIAGQHSTGNRDRLLITVADTGHVVQTDARVRLVEFGRKGLRYKATAAYSARDLAYVLTRKQKAGRSIGLEVEWHGYVALYTLSGDRFMPRYGAGYGRVAVSNDYMSWLVTDKHRYRPGDTIRWKAVMINAKGKPYKEQMSVVMNGRQTVARAVPSATGAIHGATVLADSLITRLGGYIPIEVRGTRGTTLTSMYVRAEDYELKTLHATGRLSTDQALWGRNIELHVSATDEKNDPLPSGEVQARVFFSGASRIYEPTVSFPARLSDTLRAGIVNGAAVLTIPTGAWPRADFSGRVEWSIRTPDGEQSTGSSYFVFAGTEPESRAGATVSIQTLNRADSVGFAVQSIGREFRWVVYRNGRETASGCDTVLRWRRAESSDAVYDCFVTTDDAPVRQATIRHLSRQLYVAVQQPAVVEPGAEADITVRVTDNHGRPVSGADITALSATSKLNRRVDKPADWNIKQNTYFPEYASGFTSNRICRDTLLLLRNQALIRAINADSTDFRRLVTAKDDISVVCRPSSAGQMVVPVPVDGTNVIPFGMLLIDDRCVYTAGIADPYAFRLSPGCHRLLFVTDSCTLQTTVRIDDNAGNTKTWLGIPANKFDRVELDKVTREYYIGRQRAMTAYVTEHRYRGLPYISTDGTLMQIDGTAPVLSRDYLTTYYREMTLDGAAQDSMRLYLAHNRVNVWPYERIVEVTPAIAAATPAKHVVTAMPSLGDSLLSERDLLVRHTAAIDELRHNYSIRSLRQGVFVSLLRTDKLLNVCWKKADDAPDFYNWHIEAGRQHHFTITPDTACDIVLLYGDGLFRSFRATVTPGTTLYIDAAAGEMHAANNLSLELQTRIRHNIEDRMVSRRTYVSSMPDNSNNGVYTRVYGYNSMVKAAPRVATKGVTNDALVLTSGMQLDQTESLDIDVAAAPEELYDVVMRSDFSDVAYWQPALTTDRNGEARFRVRYPDDLTEWSECFVAIRGKQRGWCESRVVARKEQSARLSMPRFAIEGDSVGAVGTGVDYAAGTSRTDTIFATATAGDSLCMEYSYKTDGEHRCVPVYKRGMEAIEASYHSLSSDTALTLGFNPAYGPMEVNVYGDMREALMHDAERIAGSDWCTTNDFLAIRLMALRMLEPTDKRAKEIARITKLLNANRLPSGMWSWWGSAGTASISTTEVVLRALGTRPTQQFAEYLAVMITQLGEAQRWTDLLRVADICRTLGYSDDARRIAEAIPADSLRRNPVARLDRELAAGHTVAFDTMRHTTYTDGEYYSLDGRNNQNRLWFNPRYEQIETTLKAYRYYEQRRDTARTRAISRWLMQYVRRTGFLSERTSIDIINTLWGASGISRADMLYQLSVDGRVVTELPYRTTVNRSVPVEYQGRRDFYISTEQNRWESRPEAAANGMSVRAEIRNTADPNLVEMHIDIVLDHDAEQLVVTAPIPAGCSYDAAVLWHAGETGREQYRDRVNIYLEQALAGAHHFVVRLNARYPGRYTVNPAQVRLINFPVFNGNDTIKQWQR